MNKNMNEIYRENLGVILGNRDTDYLAGSNSPIPFEIRNSTGNWDQFASQPDLQRLSSEFDALDCVTQSAIHCWEDQANWMLINNLWTQDALKFWNDNGYIVNGKFEVSPRFTAKKSGTTSAGNYIYKVQDSIRLDGVVPKSKYDDPVNPDWTSYYGEIPAELTALGLESLKWYKWLYEQIATDAQTINHHLQHAPIQILISTCSNWGDELILACSFNPNHAVMDYNIDKGTYKILDSYNPFRKTLSPDYKIWYANKGVLYPTNSVTIVNKQIFNQDINYGEQSTEVGKLQGILIQLKLLTLSEGDPSRYGPKTAKAVQQLMIKNNIGSWWEKYIYPAGRRVGPKIRNYLNNL